MSGGGNFGVDNVNVNGNVVIKNVNFSDNGILIYKGGENSVGNFLILENNIFNFYNINVKV